MSRHPLRRDFWEARYAEGHTPWDLGRPSEPVRRLLERHFPPPGARVLVPGCGHGHEALLLAGRGYRVTALDLVAAPVEALRRAARQRGLDVEALAADFFAWAEGRRGAFDVFLEQTFLCALEPTLRGDYERLARQVLRPGGRLLAVFMEVPWEDGPPWSIPPVLVRELFAPAHWSLEAVEPVPANPERPGPEYLAALTRRAPED